MDDRTCSSWLNCALWDVEAMFWVSMRHYEAVAVANWWYWVSRGHLCLYILHKVEIWACVTDAWRTNSLSDFERLRLSWFLGWHKTQTWEKPKLSRRCRRGPFPTLGNDTNLKPTWNLLHRKQKLKWQSNCSGNWKQNSKRYLTQGWFWSCLNLLRRPRTT